MKAYYFAPDDNKLRYGDGRAVAEGVTHEVSCVPKVCSVGLHGSVNILDALNYAPGSQLYIVEISGSVDVGDDKICGSTRTYLKKVPNSDSLLREFARAVALDAVRKFCPNIAAVVIKWLETGDESLRDSAWAAARDSARAAARDSARDSARAAAWAAAWDSARAAAWDSAWDSAWAAARAAARDSAWDSAWAAARKDQEKLLLRLVDRYLTES